MTDQDAVERANALFYSAFESLHMARMEEIWLEEPYITCAHPGWPPLYAWGPIMASWERIFEHTFEMQIILTDVRIRVDGPLAWVVLTENIESRHDDGQHTGRVFATNIFERRGTRWYLVHHHGSAVPEDDGAVERLQ